MKASILDLDPAARAAEEAKLIAILPRLPGYAAAGTVLLYANAFAEEIDTRPILLHALSTSKRVLCPRVVLPDNQMRLFEVHSLSEDLEPGLLGIPEPRVNCAEVEVATVDWALIPGLAFNLRCYRLGRGAGHYDRLLLRMRQDACCWSLGYDCQIVAELPIEPHDVPIDGVATSHRIIERPRADTSISSP